MVKKLPIEQLKAGMIAMEPIITPLGQDVAPAGVELTRQIINKMKLYSMDSLLVDEPSVLEVPTSE